MHHLALWFTCGFHVTTAIFQPRWGKFRHTAGHPCPWQLQSLLHDPCTGSLKEVFNLLIILSTPAHGSRAAIFEPVTFSLRFLYALLFTPQWASSLYTIRVSSLYTTCIRKNKDFTTFEWASQTLLNPMQLVNFKVSKNAKIMVESLCNITVSIISTNSEGFNLLLGTHP